MINKLHSLYCCMLVLIVTFWSGIDTYATTVKMQQDQKVKGIVVDEKGQIEIKFQALKELPPFSLSLYEPTE